MQCRHERNFDLLILRNHVLRLGNVNIWLVSPFNVVDLLILRNRFSGFESSNIGSAVLEDGLSAYIHEFCFQAAKRLNMDCVELERGLFVDCQSWYFQVSKH